MAWYWEIFVRIWLWWIWIKTKYLNRIKETIKEKLNVLLNNDEYKDILNIYDVNDFIKILNSNNSQVGLLHFYNGKVYIQSVTSFGNLNANYEFAEFK